MKTLIEKYAIKLLKVEADLAMNTLQTTKLTDQLEEKTTLLQGQGQELSGLLKQNTLFFFLLLFFVVSLIHGAHSVKVGIGVKLLFNWC